MQSGTKKNNNNNNNEIENEKRMIVASSQMEDNYFPSLVLPLSCDLLRLCHLVSLWHGLRQMQKQMSRNQSPEKFLKLGMSTYFRYNRIS